VADCREGLRLDLANPRGYIIQGYMKTQGLQDVQGALRWTKGALAMSKTTIFRPRNSGEDSAAVPLAAGLAAGAAPGVLSGSAGLLEARGLSGADGKPAVWAEEGCPKHRLRREA
jgi:hypothetical protein